MYDHEIYVTMDSFGDYCPANWEEIANYLNGIIEEKAEELTTTDDDGMESVDEQALRDFCADLWERYWNGEIDGAPKAKTEEE